MPLHQSLLGFIVALIHGLKFSHTDYSYTSISKRTLQVSHLSILLQRQ
jgi:hypothetical protein